MQQQGSIGGGCLVFLNFKHHMLRNLTSVNFLKVLANGLPRFCIKEDNASMTTKCGRGLHKINVKAYTHWYMLLTNLLTGQFS